jgi:hypothetical protein
MKNFKKWAFSGILFLMVSFVYSQGNTNSAMTGKVADKDGSLPGASVLAIHMPSGTKYSASTDEKGYFRISNMRTGGPYQLVLSYVGYKSETLDNIYLSLGETNNNNVILISESSVLEEVVIQGKQDNVFNANKTGAQTIIDSKKVQNLPSLSRNIADFARLTPQAQLRGDDVISIGGQNNRYNAIYIDGAVNNDVFGLAANGTNGGQTGVSPISLDAIDQFQVSVAPFDVKISGFAGGAISATTKSGNNNFEGSAYFFNRDQSLAGKTPPALAGSNPRERLADFTARTYGVRAGGAFIPNKLFYFINYERQENETPQPFNIENYTGNIGITGGAPFSGALATTKLNELVTFLDNNFGYKPGVYASNLQSLVSDKLIAKLDWNISEKHKVALRHSYVKATDLSPSNSSARAIRFGNSGVGITSTTNSTSLELNSRFNNKFSNNLVVGYTTVNDDRNPIGDPFPAVEIRDGSGSIFFGSEAFSTANLLDQKILTITDNFQINTGIHNVTIGTNNEFSSSKNVFFGRNFGYYRFNNINDFLNNAKPNRFRLGYSLVGGEGDASQGAAEFNIMQFGGYIQDEMRLSDNFKFSIGFRVDVPVWENGLVNDDFNTRTLALLTNAGKDLKGARVGQKIDNYAHISPRLGFNYDVNGDKKTQISGGVGIFTSRLPLVWPGGTYNNNGVTQGAIDINGTSNPNMPNFNPNPSVNSQLFNNGVPLGPVPGNVGAPGQFGGSIDLFAQDFRLPQVFKASLAVDQRLPAGFTLSADITYNDNISAIAYENLNIVEPTVFLNGADNRPRYNANSRVDNTYQGIYLASNTNEGQAYNTSVTLSKLFTTDKLTVNVQGTYAYGRSTVLFDATSSQNSSQWNNIETVNGSNKIGGASISDFSQGTRLLGNGFLTYKWNKNFKTRLGFFYEGAQGTPFSYVYNDNGGLLRDTFSEAALIYVPASQSEIVLVADPVTNLTPQQQWEALDSYISNDEYLRTRRGKYAERNGDRLKWSHIIDMKFAQEISVYTGKRKHTFELTADIFNFTNFLNKDWGKRYFSTFDQVQLLDFVAVTPNNVPTFRFNPNVADTKNQIDDRGLNSSRWQMQVGIRYTFN